MDDVGKYHGLTRNNGVDFGRGIHFRRLTGTSVQAVGTGEAGVIISRSSIPPTQKVRLFFFVKYVRQCAY